MCVCVYANQLGDSEKSDRKQGYADAAYLLFFALNVIIIPGNANWHPFTDHAEALDLSKPLSHVFET